MMKIEDKLQGFTITELVVMMVISAILTSAAYGLYANVSAYQIRLRQRMEQINAAERVGYLIKYDVQKFKTTDVKGNRLIVGSEEVLYEFFPDSIVRSGNNYSESFGVGGYFSSDSTLTLTLYEQAVSLSIRNQSDYRTIRNAKKEEK